jgi:hypothetical protein
MTRAKFKAIFSTPELLRDEIDRYFDVCEKEGGFATMAGLIRFLGLNSRDELFSNMDFKGYGDSIQYALLRIEEIYERRASLLKNPSGPLFVLKALGWDGSILPKKEEDKDKKGTGKISIEIVRQ